jgi:CRISPR-associated RAMP protein (TIGR02581 family)
MNDFYSFKNRYFITAELILDRPLHIGKGTSLEPTGTEMPILKTPDGRPYLPGSSVKGVIRSEFERMLRTLDSLRVKMNGNRIWACNIFDEKEKCIPQHKGINPNRKSIEELEEECKEKGRINEEKFTQRIMENCCTACSIFGSTEIASRIYFKDIFILERNIAIKTEIRDGVAIDRDTGTAKKGAKFDYEIAPAGCSFKFEAILDNVETWEVGLIGLVLQSWQAGGIAIGGKKSSGLGWGRLQNIKLEKVDEKGLLAYLIENKKESVDFNSLIKELKNKLKVEEEVNAQS